MQAFRTVASLAILSAGLVLALVACGGDLNSGPDESEKVTSSRPVPNAHPVTVRGVAAVLRRHNFSLVTVDRSTGGLAVAEVNAGDGLLGCSVYAPSTSWGPVIEVKGPGEHAGLMWHGMKGRVSYMNLNCQFHPKEGFEQEQTAQLVSALRDLANLAP